MNLYQKGAVLRAASPHHDLLLRFREVRAHTEQLAAPLSAEDQLLQSMPDASPTKWHRAHTTWFFEEFVLKDTAHYRVFHPQFGFLFNSYYEAVGARHPRPQRGLLSRPSDHEVAAYRAHVDAAMVELIQSGAVDDDGAQRIELGLQHEQQHQELMLTDILHAFAQNPLYPAYTQSLPAQPPAGRQETAFLPFDGGLVEIGHDGEDYAFDNEMPRHRVWLEPFAIADQLVTNREWGAFIADGGYENPRHWLADGWALARAQDWQAPLYWRQHDAGWMQVTLAGLMPLEPDAPVCHVSFYEADAYARWSGHRLASEAEWEHAAQGFEPVQGNFRESGYLRPVPSQGPQFFGDCWEWTSSAYAPYPGYAPAAGAIGEYNGKFMANQMVLRGGSCVTPVDHIRHTYRNFFYPHQRWQFMGVRLAQTPRAARSRSVSGFAQDVTAGLALPQKQLPCKYLYDDQGSRLFDRICELEEYYPTRTETKLLKELVPELAALVAPGTGLVEFGSGSSTKTRLLLDGIPAIGAYVPIDINRDWLLSCVDSLRADYPDLAIYPLGADFMAPFQLPEPLAHVPCLGFFPGSTIGNLAEADAAVFLRRAREGLGARGRLLIGIDLVKDIETLLAAYDDRQGITAAFDKNLLVRINRELGADFDLEAFAHEARWNPDHRRVEMHLKSLVDQDVQVAGRRFHFRAGETIHTENSHKYTIADFRALAGRAGWQLARQWQAAPGFAVLLLE